ncbi:hypothetical protein FJZ33_11145 [Candidatus Poribacteria bacterium]|nr:hypothetical protein [Candidatus Poribacteria bacterium]
MRYGRGYTCSGVYPVSSKKRLALFTEIKVGNVISSDVERFARKLEYITFPLHERILICLAWITRPL